MNRAALPVVFAVLLLTGCDDKKSPPTPAGTHFTWTRSGIAGSTKWLDVLPNTTVDQELSLQLESGAPTRLKLRVTIGDAEVTYKDGSTARRQVPKQMDAELVTPAAGKVSFTCDPELSGPRAPKPAALYATCTIQGAKPDLFSALVIDGDGAVESASTGATKVVVTPWK